MASFIGADANDTANAAACELTGVADRRAAKLPERLGVSSSAAAKFVFKEKADGMLQVLRGSHLAPPRQWHTLSRNAWQQSLSQGEQP